MRKDDGSGKSGAPGEGAAPNPRKPKMWPPEDSGSGRDDGSGKSHADGSNQ